MLVLTQSHSRRVLQSLAGWQVAVGVVVNLVDSPDATITQLRLASGGEAAGLGVSDPLFSNRRALCHVCIARSAGRPARSTVAEPLAVHCPRWRDCTSCNGRRGCHHCLRNKPRAHGESHCTQWANRNDIHRLASIRGASGAGQLCESFTFPGAYRIRRYGPAAAPKLYATGPCTALVAGTQLNCPTVPGVGPQHVWSVTVAMTGYTPSSFTTAAGVSATAYLPPVITSVIKLGGNPSIPSTQLISTAGWVFATSYRIGCA